MNAPAESQMKSSNRGVRSHSWSNSCCCCCCFNFFCSLLMGSLGGIACREGQTTSSCFEALTRMKIDDHKLFSIQCLCLTTTRLHCQWQSSTLAFCSLAWEAKTKDRCWSIICLEWSAIVVFIAQIQKTCSSSICCFTVKASLASSRPSSIILIKAHHHRHLLPVRFWSLSDKCPHQ